jgi:threonine aldolase
MFNAAVALGVEPSELAAPADSIMFCLSKGLGAPIGSLIAGTRKFIDQALSVRRMFGGSMRQVGIIAAAGLIALQKMTRRLADDHSNARLIAVGLAQIHGVRIDPETVQTNIVIFDIEASGINTAELSTQLKARGVLANGISNREMRIVTHKDVNRADCENALSVISEVLERATAVRGAD